MNKLQPLGPVHLTRVQSLQRQIADLQKATPGLICLGTNEGTFGAEECHRATGNGDPKSGNYTIWSDWQGNETVEGCDPKTAPGRFRRNPNASSQMAEAKTTMKENKATIAGLQSELDEFQLDRR